MKQALDTSGEGSGAMPGLETVVVGVSTKVITSLLEKGLVLLRSKKIMILGQERSGKTRLFDYINSRLLNPEQAEAITTEEVKVNYRRISVRTADSDTTVDITSFSDTSGQAGPYIHAGYVYTRWPSIIFIVVDATTPLSGSAVASGGTWFLEFSKKLSEYLSDSSRYRRRSCTFCILINKKDKVPKRTITAYEKELRTIFDKFLQPHLRGRSKSLLLFSTCLVKTSKETEIRKELDQILLRAINNAINRGQ